MEQIFGTIERITFQNPENGFTVAKLLMPRKKELTTLVGSLPPLHPGEQVRCFGAWKNNASHGPQFEVKECHIEAPNDLVGIKKYLSSGMIKGIGPAYAEKIIKKFGLKTLEVIEKNPDELLSIEGLGHKKVEKIKTCWGEQRSVRTIMIFLQKYGVTPLFAAKIYKFYGDEAVQKIQENPFDLARHIHGVGFKMADALAEKMGYSKEASLRIESGVEYVLHELSSEGHTCYPTELFLPKAAEILGCSHEMIRAKIDSLAKEERIILDTLLDGTEALWLKRFYLSEKTIASEMNRLKSCASPLRSIDCEKALVWVEETLHIQLAVNQKEAVKKSLVEKLHIITGGPGTGKSTITKAILAISAKLTRKILLCAPTGRAAKRMSEITRREAHTIHSLLQYDFKAGGFRRNKDNPLDCDLIIIDESSMIDTALMAHLLRAIPPRSRVLLVGDIHQLPSVGPGNVLKEMIESQTIPVTILNKIFRQAAGSKIITNAHRINEGRLPDLKGEEKGDFFFVEAKEGSDVLQSICDLVSKRLPKAYGFDPIEEIQVLAPMKKGIIGTYNLNQALQEILNPHQDPYTHGGMRLSVGDKVMQMRNNYNKEVYNGDIGRVVSVDKDEGEVVISYDGKEVLYAASELDEVTLSYATSIHKYQGSECKCVVIPMHTSHYVMLHRNLLYTGVTRGKKLVVLVGLVKAIAMAVANDDVKKRYTGLKKQLLSSL